MFRIQRAYFKKKGFPKTPSTSFTEHTPSDHAHPIWYWVLSLKTNFHSIWMKNTCVTSKWPPQLPTPSVKRIFFRKENRWEEKRCVLFWGLVWGFKRKKKFGSLTSLEKVDRFARSTSQYCSGRATITKLFELISISVLF